MPCIELTKPTKDPFDSFVSPGQPTIERKIIDETKFQAAKVAVTYHGLTLAELKIAAGDDWPEIEHDGVMLKAFAHALVAQAMRERCEIPSHYTQAVHCEGCGPVCLWEGSPDRVQGCPWCFVRVQGITPPRAHTLGLRYEHRL